RDRRADATSAGEASPRDPDGAAGPRHRRDEPRPSPGHPRRPLSGGPLLLHRGRSRRAAGPPGAHGGHSAARRAFPLSQGGPAPEGDPRADVARARAPRGPPVARDQRAGPAVQAAALSRREYEHRRHAMTPATAKERLAAFLVARGGHNFCDACAARAIGIDPSTAYRAAAKTTQAVGFVREYAL